MEEVSFTGPDGITRSGIVHGNGQKAVVVCCHGLFSWKGDVHSKFARLAHSLRTDEITLFRFDCTGCGESEGEFKQSTLEQRIVDLDCAVEYLVSRNVLCAETPLFLIGSSFGGPVILSYAARRPGRVSGLVTWSSPVDLIGFYRERFAFFFRKWQRGKTVTVESDGRLFQLGPDFLTSLEQIKPLELLAHLTAVPLLIIHGSGDETVSPVHANLLNERYPGPHQLVIIDNASHRLFEHFDQVDHLTRNWISTQLTVKRSIAFPGAEKN